VEDDDAKGARGRLGQMPGSVLELRRTDSSRLVAPGADRVQADDVELAGAVNRLGRLPVMLELLVRTREARDRRIGDVVVPRDGQDGPAEAPQEVRSAVVLLRATAVRQVAAGDDQLGPDLVDQRRQTGLDPRLFAAAHMEIREVKESCPRPGHRRGRLYTQTVVDEPTEIFDDLYLGLRAGGALRKKRRGEPLTSEEAEALGRWQRLSRVRKALTLGAFSLGTFGLGFTIGGLIFGRWRRA
jgi:hypothetical protein